MSGEIFANVSGGTVTVIAKDSPLARAKIVKFPRRVRKRVLAKDKPAALKLGEIVTFKYPGTSERNPIMVDKMNLR